METTLTRTPSRIGWIRFALPALVLGALLGTAAPVQAGHDEVISYPSTQYSGTHRGASGAHRNHDHDRNGQCLTYEQVQFNKGFEAGLRSGSQRGFDDGVYNRCFDDSIRKDFCNKTKWFRKGFRKAYRDAYKRSFDDGRCKFLSSLQRATGQRYGSPAHRYNRAPVRSSCNTW